MFINNNSFKNILNNLGKEDLIKIILNQQKEHDILYKEVERFVEKNFTGGSKSDREDYSMNVSCKDIWDLREAIKEK